VLPSLIAHSAGMSLAFSGSWNLKITEICPAQAPDEISTTVRKLLENFNDRSSPTHRDLISFPDPEQSSVPTDRREH
jgi:hypothetical protein